MGGGKSQKFPFFPQGKAGPGSFGFFPSFWDKNKEGKEGNKGERGPRAADFQGIFREFFHFNGIFPFFLCSHPSFFNTFFPSGWKKKAVFP